MTSSFDTNSDDYETLVERSVAFSGLRHDFFLRRKVDVLRRCFQAWGFQAPPALLDVGCGVGRMHPLLHPFVSSLAGSDVSQTALTRARADNPAVAYRESVGPDLPWPDGCFDVTLAVCVFHHVVPADRARLVGEMRRVTRRGGRVVIIEHNPFNPLTRLAVARCPFDADAELLTAGETRRLLEGASLTDVDGEHFLLLPTAANWAARIEELCGALPIGAQYLLSGEV